MNELGDHYEELRLGNRRRKKPRLPTEKCIYDKYWVCFDITKCARCRHNADLLSKLIP